MEVVNSQLKFTYEDKKYEAELSMFTPKNLPMFRVKVPSKGFKELVFIFYQIKQRELFWYPLEDYWKQGMAKAIAEALFI